MGAEIFHRAQEALLQTADFRSARSRASGASSSTSRVKVNSGNWT